MLEWNNSISNLMARFASYPRTMTKDASIQRKELLSPSLSSPSWNPANMVPTCPRCSGEQTTANRSSRAYVWPAWRDSEDKGTGQEVWAPGLLSPAPVPSSDLMPLAPRPDSSVKWCLQSKPVLVLLLENKIFIRTCACGTKIWGRFVTVNTV